MKRLAKYFLQGLLYIAPIGVTLYIIWIAFIGIDRLLTDLDIFKDQGIFHKFSFPGMGIIVILSLVTLIGFLGQKLITSPLSNALDKAMNKAPLVKIIYTSVKDLLSAFVGKEKKFDKPVMVSLDNEGVAHRLGFITAVDLEEMGIIDMVGVYFPSSYGFVGDLFIVPTEKVKPLDANSAMVMKFIVSGGVSKVKRGKTEPHDEEHDFNNPHGL